MKRALAKVARQATRSTPLLRNRATLFAANRSLMAKREFHDYNSGNTDYNLLSDLSNPANPISPLSSLNPANPLSPLNSDSQASGSDSYFAKGILIGVGLGLVQLGLLVATYEYREEQDKRVDRRSRPSR